MITPKIYLETTIFNYYFDTEREAHPYTVKLFEEIRAGKYEPYTSEYVTEELNKASAEKQEKMLKLIEEYGVRLIKASEDAERLAAVYRHYPCQVCDRWTAYCGNSRQKSGFYRQPELSAYSQTKNSADDGGCECP